MDQAMQPDVEIDRLATRGREHQRRTRVLRGALPTMLVGLLLCVAAVWMRNHLYVAEAEAEFRESAAALLETFEGSRIVPLNYEPPELEGVAAPKYGFHYVDAGEIQSLRDTDEQMLVAYSDGIRQILKADARVVAIRTGGAIRIESISGFEFARLRDEQQKRVVRDPGP